MTLFSAKDIMLSNWDPDVHPVMRYVIYVVDIVICRLFIFYTIWKKEMASGEDLVKI